MNAAALSMTERLGAEYSAVAARLPAQVVSSARRESALRRFLDLGLPHIRDDQWRYANLRPVERAVFAATAGDAHVELRLALPQRLPGIPRLIFVNGHYQPALSSPEALPPGARVLPLATAERGDELTGMEFSADERFAWINEAFAEDGVLLQIGGHASVELLFVTQPTAAGTAPTAAYPRLQVVLQPGAQLCLVERHLGGAGPQGLIDATAQLRLEAGAHCTHYRLQACERDALFLDSLVAQVGADAEYRLMQMALGAGMARASLRVQLDGARASAVLRAVTLADEQRVLDTALTVEHNATATRSEQVFRAIANSRARIGMLSRVRVSAQARGADCRQSLRGLIAAEQAEIDLRPELQIHTDEVQASHGATTGALDDTALFYLLSRGLDRDIARLLLEWAFLEDVLAQVQLPALRAQVERATVEGMGRADTLGELL